MNLRALFVLTWQTSSIYLKNHLYGNGTTADLWAGISQSTGLDVAKIMDAWTLKIGFPVITVEETSDGLKLRQNRFLSTGAYVSLISGARADFWPCRRSHGMLSPLICSSAHA